MNDKRPDIAVVGGGIVGLWCARMAAQQGASVLLIEKRIIGAGASGGVLGALMPHQPTGWNAKKQFQLDGLTTLPGMITALEAETKLSCGYRRVGRIMPIGHAQKRRQSAQWSTGAEQHWTSDYRWQVVDDNPAPGWIADDALTHGANFETLSARIDPRLYIAALDRAVAMDKNIHVRTHCAVQFITDDGALCCTDGTSITPGSTIVTAGVETFSLLDPINPERFGRGVKGQGALLDPKQSIAPDAPIIYDNGTYVIAHDTGRIAVGSTSENEYDDGAATDDKLDALIETARALCPKLQDATIASRWAGVRPRAVGREPVIGAMPDRHGVIIATGGFKISFAIAHLMAQAAVDFACDRSQANLPDQFLPANRFGA